jgi:hypothetical protein
MKKVFISQSMKGFSEEEIRHQRTEAQNAIAARFGEVEFLGTEPKTFENTPNDKEKIAMLSDSLKILSQSDMLVLIKPQGALPNGCAIETSVAARYGIPIEVYRPNYGNGWESFG